MTKEELKEMLKDNLSLKTRKDRDCTDLVQVEILFDDEVIASDLFDLKD